MPELKPCTFCGDALELRTVARDWYRVEHPDNDACPLGGNDYTYAQTAQGLKTLLTDWSQRHIPAGQVLVPRELLAELLEAAKDGAAHKGEYLSKKYGEPELFAKFDTLLHP